MPAVQCTLFIRTWPLMRVAYALLLCLSHFAFQHSHLPCPSAHCWLWLLPVVLVRPRQASSEVAQWGTWEQGGDVSKICGGQLVLYWVTQSTVSARVCLLGWPGGTGLGVPCEDPGYGWAWYETVAVGAQLGAEQ